MVCVIFIVMSFDPKSPDIASKGFLTNKFGVSAPWQNVVCDDPVDVTPVVDAVKKRVDEIKSADADAKIIVWAGEIHTNPVHKLLQPSILQAVSDVSTPIMGVELWRNRIIGYADALNYHVSDDYVDRFIEKDRDGKIQNALLALSHGQSRASNTIEAIARFHIDNGFKAVFTDAARYMQGNTLDPMDSATHLAFELSGENTNRNDVRVRSRKGLEIRNRVMLEEASSLLNDTDVVVQMCGMSHIIGEKDFEGLRGYDYETSLAGFVNEARASGRDNLYDIKLISSTSVFKVDETYDHVKADNTLFVTGLYRGDYMASHVSELDLVHSVKGVPSYFSKYGEMNQDERYRLSVDVYDFIRSMEDEENANGLKRVWNRKPEIF